jgi:hypothetical protein
MGKNNSAYTISATQEINTLDLFDRQNACVQLRRFPYPYKAMLAICSDLDETRDRHVYWEIMRFLNTTENTAMGPGVGLEVGNSIYFNMPPEQFAYWNTDDAGREMVRTLIQSGHIDCLHSYGDLATKRQHAARALEELDRNNCKLQVWVDHGTALTNFGSDIMQGHGDEPGHAAYHADLTTGYGIKYICRGRVTSITGQNSRPNFSQILNSNHSIASTKTFIKEISKHVLANFGNSKYRMHKRNRLIHPSFLRDGTPVLEFIRYNPHWAGPGKDSKPKELAEALSTRSINHLLESCGVGVLYTHLGKMGNSKLIMHENIIDCFRIISELFHKRQLLVCTTRRLLQYNYIRNSIRFRVNHDDNKYVVIIDSITNPHLGSRLPTVEELQGITFKIPQTKSIRLILGNREIETKKYDNDKYTYMAMPWSRITLPQL